MPPTVSQHLVLITRGKAKPSRVDCCEIRSCLFHVTYVPRLVLCGILLLCGEYEMNNDPNTFSLCGRPQPHGACAGRGMCSLIAARISSTTRHSSCMHVEQRSSWLCAFSFVGKRGGEVLKHSKGGGHLSVTVPPRGRGGGPLRIRLQAKSYA